uniref:Putative monooxygenase p33MONOX n=1 Tax=Cercocebus atys TaxID=9531 RepID=A0A2K5LN66_CERAT
MASRQLEVPALEANVPALRDIPLGTQHGQRPLETSNSRAQVSAPRQGGGRRGQSTLPAMTLSSAIDSVDKVPVVKAKTTHVIMSSLITKQTQESIQHFGQQAGLRDAGYPLHEGLTTEETRYLGVLQSGEITKEERQPASAQSTPSTTPHSSPKQRPRGWFTSGSSTALPGPNPSNMDSGSEDKDSNLSDKWSLFGLRSLQKYDSGSFATQKPSPMELIRAQANRMAEDPAALKPPKMDIPMMKGKKQPPRAHNLQPCDLNVLTLTGF